MNQILCTRWLNVYLNASEATEYTGMKQKFYSSACNPLSEQNTSER